MPADSTTWLMATVPSATQNDGPASQRSASVYSGGPVDLAAYRHRREEAALLRLLRRRDHLAATAADHTVHELGDADWLWTQLDELEEAIKQRSLRTWQRSWPEWVQRDVERMQEPHQPATCSLCTPRSPSPPAAAAA